MRKFQKQQLMEVIGSLHEIHQSSAAGLAAGSYQTVRNLLTDCQEAAIQVGKIIEQWEGEGTDAVACLEQYCETVYRVAVQAEKLSFTKAYASLEEVLTKAENAIRHMPEKKEIVFMPYKASMWDSLESVYLAAREDENCDAYVVPNRRMTASAKCITREMSIRRILRLLTMRIMIWRKDVRMRSIFIIHMMNTIL